MIQQEQTNSDLSVTAWCEALEVSASGYYARCQRDNSPRQQADARLGAEIERALRHGVIWRKLCYGTASENGSRFVERILTVIATARQQSVDLMGYLTDAMLARRAGFASPALL